MTRDIGNDAMLAAADRFYNALYSDECECARCSDPVQIDDARVWDGDEYYCDSCLDNEAMEPKRREKLVLPQWAGDFVSEVLFEDEGERSAFFPRNYRFSEEQHYHAIAAE